MERVEPFFFLKNMFSWDTLMYIYIYYMYKDRIAASQFKVSRCFSHQEYSISNLGFFPHL